MKKVMTSISLELLSCMLTKGAETHFKVVAGIPETHELCDAQINTLDGTVELFLDVPDDTPTTTDYNGHEEHDVVQVVIENPGMITKAELDVAKQARAEQYETILRLRAELDTIYQGRKNRVVEHGERRLDL